MDIHAGADATNTTNAKGNEMNATRSAVHAELAANDHDWMYNRHCVGSGADAADAPATLAEARLIAREAIDNGVPACQAQRWLSAAEYAIRSATRN